MTWCGAVRSISPADVIALVSKRQPTSEKDMLGCEGRQIFLGVPSDIVGITEYSEKNVNELVLKEVRPIWRRKTMRRQRTGWRQKDCNA